MIGNAIIEERFLEGARLGIGSVQHRDIAQSSFTGFGHPSYGRGDLSGLVEFVGRLVDQDRLALEIFRPEPFLLATAVVPDHVPRGFEDGAGASIVLLQFDRGTPGMVLFEPQNDVHIGAAPAIDALVVVAHHAQIASGILGASIAAGKQPGQAVLGPVDILVFVHQHMVEFRLVVTAHVFPLFEQPHRHANQIVEIQRPVQPQLLLVQPVDLGDDPLEETLEMQWEIVRGKQFLLGSGYERQNCARRELPFVQIQLMQAFLGKRDLIGIVVNHEIPGKADRFSAFAQYPGAGAVEGTAPHGSARFRSEQAGQSALQLLGRLVRECDRENLSRPYTAFQNHMGYAMGQHARFAGSGAGEDQKRAFAVQNGHPLRVVESCQQIQRELGYTLGHTAVYRP